MTLEQLRIFVAVAEREHMTRAAEALNLTQSATSAAIAALEERHDVKLFDRVGRRIVLTQTGHAFLDEARAVLARATLAGQALDDLAGLRRGMLRLGASQTVANYWLPPLMQAFRLAHPGVTLDLQIGNTEQIAEAVADLSVDLGIVEGSPQRNDLKQTTVPGDRTALIVPKGHEWSGKPPRTGKDYRAVPWVLRETGSGTRAMLEDLLALHGLTLGDLDVALELPSNEAVRAAVQAGAGASLLSMLVAEPSILAGTVCEVAVDLPPRSFHILRHKERHETGLEQAFISLTGAQGAGVEA